MTRPSAPVRAFRATHQDSFVGQTSRLSPAARASWLSRSGSQAYRAVARSAPGRPEGCAGAFGAGAGSGLTLGAGAGGAAGFAGDLRFAGAFFAGLGGEAALRFFAAGFGRSSS